jgi:GntR family transcriptional regulator/MocR family aminotransferase
MASPAAVAHQALNGASPVPLYRQIYSRITRAVLDGGLAPGARLPSARSLAAQLAIARGTVEMAYQLLAGEGYIETRGAAGTIVAPTLDRKLLQPRRTARSGPRAVTQIAASVPTSVPPLFKTGLPAVDAFPHKIWARLVARQARSLGSAGLVYQPPAGHEPLRVQIARYLAVARGVHCAPEQVFVTSGYQGALGLIGCCLMPVGCVVCVEDPAYHIGSDALRLAGARLVGVPVDRDGFDVAQAVSQAQPARLAVVTPTHQFPLGVTMSLARRVALLKWAAATHAWIVEDDYDSEFRYQGRPLPALKSLDRGDRVLYVGTFSKVLAPGLRVGYLVVPASLVERFADAAALLQPPPAVLIQATIATFLEQGLLARHIRRMRQLYAERRAALAEALGEHVRPALGIELRPGGMHLLARLPRGTDDVKLVARLARQGIAPTPLSVCGVEAPCFPGLLIGFANVDVKKAAEAARRLAAALGGTSARLSAKRR